MMPDEKTQTTSSGRLARVRGVGYELQTASRGRGGGDRAGASSDHVRIAGRTAVRTVRYLVSMALPRCCRCRCRWSAATGLPLLVCVSLLRVGRASRLTA